MGDQPSLEKLKVKKSFPHMQSTSLVAALEY